MQRWNYLDVVEKAKCVLLALRVDLGEKAETVEASQVQGVL